MTNHIVYFIYKYIKIFVFQNNIVVIFTYTHMHTDISILIVINIDRVSQSSYLDTHLNLTLYFKINLVYK